MEGHLAPPPFVGMRHHNVHGPPTATADGPRPMYRPPPPSPAQERDTIMRTDPPAASADGPAVPPKCHFFNSFFADKLYRKTKRYSYEAVKQWTLEKKLKGYMQVEVWICEISKCGGLVRPSWLSFPRSPFPYYRYK